MVYSIYHIILYSYLRGEGERNDLGLLHGVHDIICMYMINGHSCIAVTISGLWPCLDHIWTRIIVGSLCNRSGPIGACSRALLASGQLYSALVTWLTSVQHITLV